MSSKKQGSRFDDLFGAARAKDEAIAPRDTEHSDVQTSKHSDTQTSKSKNPDYQRTTVYLPKKLHRKLRAAAMTEGKEMSDVIEALVAQWLESHSDV